MADDTARNPEKAAKARAEEQMYEYDEDDEEVPEWYKLATQPNEELKAKALAWMESESAGRPDAHAKLLELLDYKLQHGLLRSPPDAIVIDRYTDFDAARRLIQTMGDIFRHPC